MAYAAGATLAPVNFGTAIAVEALSLAARKGFLGRPKLLCEAHVNAVLLRAHLRRGKAFPRIRQPRHQGGWHFDADFGERPAPTWNIGMGDEEKGRAVEHTAAPRRFTVLPMPADFGAKQEERIFLETSRGRNQTR